MRSIYLGNACALLRAPAKPALAMEATNEAHRRRSSGQ